MSEELMRRLDEFESAMYEKFRARHEKNLKRGNSVFSEDFDWEHGLDQDHLVAHLEEELTEWLEAKSDAERRAEAVDVANMMFLLWTTTKEAKPQVADGA